jgi:hypothetical protein
VAVPARGRQVVRGINQQMSDKEDNIPKLTVEDREAEAMRIAEEVNALPHSNTGACSYTPTVHPLPGAASGDSSAFKHAMIC